MDPALNELIGAGPPSDEVAVLRWSNSGEQLAVADRAGVLNIYLLRQ